MTLDFDAMLNQIQRKPAPTQASTPPDSRPRSQESLPTTVPKGAHILPPPNLVFPEQQPPAREATVPQPTPTPQPQPQAQPQPQPRVLPTPDTERVSFVPTAKAGRSPNGPSSRPSKTVKIRGRDIHMLRYLAEARYATPTHVHAALGVVAPEAFNPDTGKVDNSLDAIDKRLKVLRKHRLIEGVAGTIFNLTQLVKITDRGLNAASAHDLTPTKVGAPGSASESLSHILLVAAEIAKVRGGYYTDLGLPHDARIILETRLAQAVTHAHERQLWTPKYVPAKGGGFDPSLLDTEDYAVYRASGEFGTPDLVVIGEDRAVSIEVECSRKTSAALRKNLGAYAESGREVWYIVGSTDPLADPDSDTLTALYRVMAELEGKGFDTSNILITEADMRLATPHWHGDDYEAWRERILLHTGRAV